MNISYSNSMPQIKLYNTECDTTPINDKRGFRQQDQISIESSQYSADFKTQIDVKTFT